MNKKNYQVDMINSPILKSLTLFSLPIIASNLLQLLFNAADIVVVGKYAGELCLAAVSATTHLVYLIINVFTGMAVGANVLVARLIGKRKENEIPSIIHTSYGFALITGFCLMIFGIFISRPALELMGCPNDVIDLASLYLKIYFLSMPGLIVYNFGAASYSSHPYLN